MQKAIIEEAETVMIPKKMHTLGKSYGKGSKAIKKSGDLSKSANDVAKEDIKTYEDLMDENDPKNKHGEDLTDKDKEKMDSVDDDCKDKIKKGLEKMKKIDYDKFLEDKILENLKCDK